MKMLIDGEGSFSARGTIKDNYPVPTTFTSKIVSSAETSDVTMVLDEGNVKKLETAPLPSRDLVPVTEANRQGITDPLTLLSPKATLLPHLLPNSLRKLLTGVEDYADNGEFDGRITQLRTKSFKCGGRLCLSRWHARQPTTPRKRKLGDERGKALGPRGPVLPDLGG